MTKDISEADARLALRTVSDRQQEVLAEVGLPRWYWWGLALGWIAMGLVSDLGAPWVAGVATLAFGAVHSTIAQRVFSGRHRSAGLSVRGDLVSRRLPLVLFAFLVALVLVTIGLALAADADGAGHPAVVASIPVAVAILGGGPQVVAAVRRRAERAAA